MQVCAGAGLLRLWSFRRGMKMGPLRAQHLQSPTSIMMTKPQMMVDGMRMEEKTLLTCQEWLYPFHLLD